MSRVWLRSIHIGGCPAMLHSRYLVATRPERLEVRECPVPAAN